MESRLFRRSIYILPVPFPMGQSLGKERCIKGRLEFRAAKRYSCVKNTIGWFGKVNFAENSCECAHEPIRELRLVFAQKFYQKTSQG